MLFNSFEFVLFFPLVIALYFACPQRWRWLLLLASSYYFYMCWKPEYIVLILISTLIDYYSAKLMDKEPTKSGKKKYLYLSLISNLGLLFGFKYFNFFNDNVRAVFDQFNIFYDVPEFSLLLPVGISFYTFQTLSYTMEVYRGSIKPDTHLGKFALYVAFWPQLVAGPIERADRLLPQFYVEHDFNYQRVVSGLRLMLWGFFKKVVIADRVGVFVDMVYNNPGEYKGFSVLLATYFFTYQIYCDFSGYSDIAIGSAQVMGFKLMDNFRIPYYSKSISEFWKRWHISLSTWFRDYLYIPLGGNRVVKWRWYYNLFITFLVSGLWHGANWTFVAWGALHGSYLVLAIWLKDIKDKVKRFIGLSETGSLKKVIDVLITFHLVVFAWIFFRANNVTDAFEIIGNMASFDKGQLGVYIFGPKANQTELVLSFVFIAVLELVHFLKRKKGIRGFVFDLPVWVRWLFYYLLLFVIIFFGKHGEQAFIYFQF